MDHLLFKSFLGYLEVSAQSLNILVLLSQLPIYPVKFCDVASRLGEGSDSLGLFDFLVEIGLNHRVVRIWNVKKLF